MKPEVTVVRTGTANLASVLAGLARAGATATVKSDPRAVEEAAFLALPGVGAFGAAMAQLEKSGCIQALKNRIEQGRPTLAVCLGLQVLCEKSEESAGVGGLGVIEKTVGKFTGDIRIPQLGWNKVEPESGCELLETGYAYFANSYRLAKGPQDWNCAYADHGGRFVAAMEKDAVLACQFHPELSGDWGLALLKRWLAKGGAAC